MAEQDALAPGQVPDHTIAAGETLELKCPGDSTPEVKASQVFPEEGAKAEYKVLLVNNQTVLLGFYKGGSFKVEIPCTNSQKISNTVLLKVIEPQGQPEAAPPLGVEAMAYPLWMWIAIALILTLPILTFFYLRNRKKRLIKKLSQKARPLTPSEKLEKYLKETSALLKKEKTITLAQNKEVYSTGYTVFRTFLNERFKLHAAHETTREFLGTLSSTAKLWNLSQQDVALIDSLLTSADQVRFASDNPEASMRDNFVKNIYDLYKKYQIAAVQVQDQR